MEGDPRVALEPGPDGRRLVGADVVEDDVQLLIAIHPVDPAQEGQEVVPRVARPGLLGDLAGRHVEGGGQAGPGVGEGDGGLLMNPCNIFWALRSFAGWTLT